MADEIKDLKLDGSIDSTIYEKIEQVRVNDDFKASNQLKSVVSTAPTYVPVNFSEQEVYYLNGTTYRKYFYIENSWRYITLT